MVPGFNHNVKYRGRIFHCQTEDSGIGNPHIITHLFVGGNILATKKTSYADIVKTDRLEEVVSELMQEQHKEILKKLLSGQYDESIEQRGQNASHLNGPAPLNVDAGAQNRASMLAPGNMSEAPKKAPPPKAPVPVAPVVSTTAPQAAAQSAKIQAAAAAAAAVPQEVIDAQKLQVAPKPKEAPATGTIFGEDLISEKSLDEVILSYLSTEADR